MLRFVIFGCGIRGKRLADILGKDRVVAYIDNDMNKVGMAYKEIPIVSLDEYRKKYQQYIILLTNNARCLKRRNEIIEQLLSYNIFNFLEMAECPWEFIGANNRKKIEEFPIPEKEEYCLYGISIFSLLLCERMLNRKKRVVLVPQIDWDTNKLMQIAECIPFNYIIDEHTFQGKYESIMCMVREDLENMVKLQNVFDKVENYYDYSLRFQDYYNSSILQFKGSADRNRCFIVACGPSLTSEDLQVLYENNERCFSMNGIFKIFNSTDWRPDYYMLHDPTADELYYQSVIEMDVKYKIISDACVKYWKVPQQANLFKIHTAYEQFVDWLPTFSESLEYSVTAGGTVAFSCIQMAVYMGYREIYLLGVDCNYSKFNDTKQMHFTEDYNEGYDETHDGDEDIMKMAYQSARNYADSHNIKIYNATRGGELEVFERVDFDSLF